MISIALVLHIFTAQAERLTQPSPMTLNHHLLFAVIFDGLERQLTPEAVLIVGQCI
jgi:hypothetical protein